MSRHLILPLAFTVAAFASAESRGAWAENSGGAYELRGFFGSGEKLEVSVRPAGSENSRWLRVGKKYGDLLIESADAKSGTATLVVRGRRVTLRLAGESAPATPAAPLAVEAVNPAGPDYKSPEYRQKRFQELREKLTEAQEEAFGRAMQEGFEKVHRENPSVDFRDPANAELAMTTRLAIMRQASEAAHQLPDKEGNLTPVPADFEPLLREEFKADMDRRNARRTEASNAAPAPALQKTGGGTLSVSGGNTYSGATTVSSGTLTVSGGETSSTH